MKSPESKELVSQIENILKAFNPTAANPYRIQKEEEGPNNLDLQLVNAEKKIALFFQHVMIGSEKKLLLLIKVMPKGLDKASEQKFIYDFGQQTWVSKDGEYLDTIGMGKLINRKL